MGTIREVVRTPLGSDCASAAIIWRETMHEGYVDIEQVVGGIDGGTEFFEGMVGD